MSRYSDQVRDEYGRTVPGVSIYVYKWDADADAAGDLETLTDDLSAPLANPLISDADGLFYFNSVDGQKLIEYHFGGKVEFRDLILVGDLPVPQAVFGGLFVNASALSIPVGMDMIGTTGYAALGVGGANYIYDATVDAAYVTAHPLSSFISANGRGFRLDDEQDLALEMFGAIRNSSTSGAKTANNAALTAALAYEPIVVDTYYGPSRTIKLLEGYYHFSQSYFNVKHSVALLGAGGWAGVGGYCATRFIGPNNWKGLIFQADNTIDETVASPLTTNAAGSLVVGIEFVGNDAQFDNWNAITTGQGIWARTMISVIGCKFTQLWNGWVIKATSGAGGADEGQASGCFGMANSFTNNRNNGLDISGADSNIGTFLHHNYIANGRFGCRDWAFLSNRHIGGHNRDNGCRTDYFNVSSQCHYSGNLYYVNETARPNPDADKASDADTTDAALRVGNPSTNSLWTLVGSGSVDINYPEFTTFTGTFQKGGPHIQRRGQWGSYCESSQPPVHLSNEVAYDASIVASGFIGGGAGILDGQLSSKTYTDLGQTRVSTSVADPAFAIHNTGPNQGYGLFFTHVFEQGFETDGVTPRKIAGISASPSAAGVLTSYGTMQLWLRQFGTSTLRQIIELGDSPLYFSPIIGDNLVLLGQSSQRWSTIYGYTGDFKTQVKVNSVKVLGVQGSAIARLTRTATSGSLPTPDGSITIANAATPTVVELLEYCTEIEAKLEAVTAALRAATGHGLIA